LRAILRPRGDLVNEGTAPFEAIAGPGTLARGAPARKSDKFPAKNCLRPRLSSLRAARGPPGDRPGSLSPTVALDSPAPPSKSRFDF